MPPTNPSTLHPNPSLAALPYNSALSLWLSVDPLSDKYPNLSPYVYCADNPVRLVDVDGREISAPDDPPKQSGFRKFMNSLDTKIRGNSDNSHYEGHSDGANQGTTTQQDVEVGLAAVATVVSAGAAIEAATAVETAIGIASTINSADDVTVNTSGQTFAQRIISHNQSANKTVAATKTVTSVVSAGYSGYKVGRVITSAVKNGAQVLKDNAITVATEVANFASNTYDSVKSFFKKSK